VGQPPPAVAGRLGARRISHPELRAAAVLIFADYLRLGHCESASRRSVSCPGAPRPAQGRTLRLGAIMQRPTLRRTLAARDGRLRTRFLQHILPTSVITTEEEFFTLALTIRHIIPTRGRTAARLSSSALTGERPRRAGARLLLNLCVKPLEFDAHLFGGSVGQKSAFCPPRAPCSWAGGTPPAGGLPYGPTATAQIKVNTAIGYNAILCSLGPCGRDFRKEAVRCERAGILLDQARLNSCCHAGCHNRKAGRRKADSPGSPTAS